MKRFFLAATAGLGMLAGAIQPAAAHSISIGFANSGPGSVTIWLGTYSVGHTAYHLEGSLRLEGVLGTVFGPTIVPFSMLAPLGVKPIGLIDGVTNFYAPGPTGPLVGTEGPFNAFCPACGPVNRWQGVTFNGLGPGDYLFTYIPIANPTVDWDVLNPNMNGTFNLRGVVNPVPEPASIALIGLGLLGFARAARRLAKT